MKQKFKFIQDYMGFKEGDVVYEFTGHTYGIKQDDEEMLGIPCIAISREEGKNPFAVVPEYTLIEIQYDKS